MNRPSWDRIWIAVAADVSRRSTCPRGTVGAVVVSADNRLLATGYNGAPRGQPHCTDVGCEVDGTGSCRRAVHAEINALIQAGRDAAGGTLYSTTEPCPTCAGAVINAGIVRVVYVRPYKRIPGSRRGLMVLEDAGVSVGFMVEESVG